MPKGKRTNNLVDNKNNDIIDENLISDSADSSDSANSDFQELAIKTVEKSTQKAKKNEIPDLRAKYPSRSLEELRKIDFVQQYESIFPKIERPGYLIAWICNTPNKNNIELMHREGYDFVEGVDPVPSGYSDFSGEDKYAHHAMQIPVEIYNKKQKALQDRNKKMYGHILNPNKKGNYLSRSESGMYEPEGRKIQNDKRVLIRDQDY